MNKIKQNWHWAFAVISAGWAIYYAVSSENRGLFWLMVANIFFVLLIGTLSTLLESPIRKKIRKNMTAEEKRSFSAIGKNAGTALGIRVAPIAFIAGITIMVFGLEALLYLIPVAVLLLIVLCMPVWRNVRKESDHALLSSGYAITNGITTLKRHANKSVENIGA